ncbi:ADP-ribosylation factor-binding protein GGA3 isoform X2 [Thrips palmi]|nr:ADP-ribosylation factor-binding protein GGA3 isoform X2 [Thrips palmi]
MVNKEPNSAHIATKLITTRIQSQQEWEALQSLNVLEACMKRCGSSFHSEVGKFRFLNEMIKLVSPKYLGGQTPKPVRERVLQLMYSWTIEYARETKIKEAYQMLRKQGVVTEDPPTDNSGSQSSASNRNSAFEDEKKQRLLQKLLQSKNPEDLQAANRLIKTMVKEDERRTEIISRRTADLDAAHNNARLLSEMLDCYRPASSSKEDLELIKELHQSCQRLGHQISKDFKPEDSLYEEGMETLDELTRMCAKYVIVVVEGLPCMKIPDLPSTSKVSSVSNAAASLLDLGTPGGNDSTAPVIHELADLVIPPVSNHSGLGTLGDLFSLSTAEAQTSTLPSSTSSVLQPMPLNAVPASSTVQKGKADEKPNAIKALEDLDALGESLLKESLPPTVRAGSQFNKAPAKVPMNLLGRNSSSASDSGAVGGIEFNSTPAVVPGDNVQASTSLDLDFLVGIHDQPSSSKQEKSNTLLDADDLLNGDDAMVDLTDDAVSPTIPPSQPKPPTEGDAPSASTPAKENPPPTPVEKKAGETVEPVKVTEVKSLNDISVSLDSIKPGPIAPLTALDERNGISVVLHLARDTPRPDVSVYVVSTISKNSSPLSNYVFQAVVPKTCKLRLLPASSSELPAHNPFLPPSAITQVMLVANPSKVPVNLKFMVSYSMDDDTVTEMGEVESLPMLS